MSFIKYYKKPNSENCQGRIDDENDYLSFRWHQWIKILNLNEEIKATEQSGTSIAFSFLGFCCDIGVAKNLGRIGAAAGPERIRKSLANLPCTFSQDTKIYNAGDIVCINNNLETAQDHLALGVQKILSANIFPILLGGGHEIAFGHYKGIFNFLSESKTEKHKIGIINFDANQ